MVFFGLGVRHSGDVAKTLCFPGVLRAMFQKPNVFLCFVSDPGVTGVARLHRFPYQIRQKPYRESTVWGKMQIRMGAFVRKMFQIAQGGPPHNPKNQKEYWDQKGPGPKFGPMGPAPGRIKKTRCAPWLFFILVLPVVYLRLCGHGAKAWGSKER